MKIDLPANIEIIVLTGPECSGKTTTANRLADQYNLPRVKEYAREYLTENGPNYDFEDLEKITQIQLDTEIKANQEHPLIICDTDQVTLEIWSLEVFDTSLNLKDARALKKHYLLCCPDIPWEPDPLRENPLDRDRLFDRYKTYLEERKLPFTILNESERRALEITKCSFALPENAAIHSGK